MKQNELEFKTCNHAYPERTQVEEVRVTIGENHKRHTMSISFYHHAQTKITQGDRMVYARTGNRIYFSKPPEGKKGFKLTKRNKYEDDRKAMGFYKTYFSEADMAGRYDLQFDPECELYYIEIAESADQSAHTNC